MKTKEELNALKEEVETVSKKLRDLTEEELKQVSGGLVVDNLEDLVPNDLDYEIWYQGVRYINTYLIGKDSSGRECYFYYAEDGSGFFLTPIG